MEHEIKMGDTYKSKDGLIGTVVDFQRVKMLQFKNPNGKIIQTVVAKKIDLSKFEKMEG